ncbi:MAG TPA: oxygen-independent coproporphyrinogen III oxidase [Steroidobacteraceae bacterium]|nr:oxygen-independent coproporphyrinogen III oxidase [Steroidobacteraceae bacterium]
MIPRTASQPASPITFDAELLRRYDGPGPRYTSYPTAPAFHNGFGALQLREQAQRSNDEPIPRPLSIYVHVPYCFSPCFYCGCNRIITRDRSRAAPYLLRLARETELVARWFDRDREVVQVHLGGGTPNFLSPAQIYELMESLRSHFRLTTRAERDFSIELDPRFLQLGDIASYAAAGFSRASFGVQDFDPVVQRAVNREQTVEQTLDAIQACRDSGFRSVNVDLIYGLPKQNADGFARTLDIVTAARPDRIAVYGYAHMPQVFKAQTQIEEADLPAAADKLALLQLAIERLGAAGYRHIGMDHFALPDDDLALAQDAGTLHRNFMGYTTHADCDLIGLGVSAISHIGDSFSQNPRDLPGWEIALDQGQPPVWRGLALDRDDLIRGDVIQQLMCNGAIDIGLIERRHDIDFDQYFGAALLRLVPLIEDGLAVRTGDRIAATSRGRLLLRIIAMCFDKYLEKSDAAAARPRYSRVI